MGKLKKWILGQDDSKMNMFDCTVWLKKNEKKNHLTVTLSMNKLSKEAKERKSEAEDDVDEDFVKFVFLIVPNQFKSITTHHPCW